MYAGIYRLSIIALIATHIAGKFGGEMFGKFTVLKRLAEKSLADK